METKTIKEQLEAIVNTEIENLKKVLDEWFKADEDRTSLVLSDDPTQYPFFNMYNENNDAVEYNVKRIEVTHEGYYLVLNMLGEQCCEENNRYHYLDQDKWILIPGELTRLTEEVRRKMDPAEPIYHFTDEQWQAIGRFKDAMKELGEKKIFLLVDCENRQFRFANSVGECFFDGSDGYQETGYVERVASVDVDRLPDSDYQYDCDFFAGDGLDLVKEK